MSKKVQPVPPGFRTITPYLIVKGAAQAIEFYKKAFAAEERFRMPAPDGSIMHAELKIGDSMLMIADEFPKMGIKGVQTIGGSPVMMHLYVDDADAWFERATKAGAKVSRPMADQFYGDRSGCVDDPFGYAWHLSTHVKDVSPEEMAAAKP